MKTKNLKCIFNWLYGNGSDRALTERQPREERGMKTSLYRPVSVSYLSAVLSSMHSQRGLLALARRIYSSKDNSVCLSRCAFPLQVGLLRGTTQKQLSNLFQASAGIGKENQCRKEKQQKLCSVLG